jgi:hypothetical protein
MAVLWVVAPCSLVEVLQRFRGPCCLRHQGLKSYMSVGNFMNTYGQFRGHSVLGNQLFSSLICLLVSWLDTS